MYTEVFSDKAATILYGPFAPHFGQIVDRVYSERQAKIFSFMSIDVFEKLDTSERNKVLWDEILQRSELCSYATLERTARLGMGAIESFGSNNLLSWAGSARNLVESVADSYYILRSVAATLADNHEAIRVCLAGEAVARPLSSKRLEDELIHFTHGRTLRDEEPAVDGHTARSARDYISTLKQANAPDPYDAYKDLCNLTHPSAYTVTWMLTDHDHSAEKYDFKFNPLRKMEQGQILALSIKYKELFHSLLPTAMNSALLALKMCESLGREGTGVANIDLSKIPAWDKMTKDAEDSSAKNIVRVISGYYDKIKAARAS